LQDSKSLK
jgi:hypothetical protein